MRNPFDLSDTDLIQRWKELNASNSRPPLSDQEWFEYGYQQHPGLFRTANDDTYEVRFTRKLSRPLASVIDEGVAAAMAIANRYHQEPIALLLSGGLDSHFVAKCFMKAGVKFNSFIIRHANDMNVHELKGALQFVDANRLPYTFLDLDMTALIDDGTLESIARVSQCSHIGYAPWCLMIHKLQPTGTVLISGHNEPEVQWEPSLEAQLKGDFSTGEWVFYDNERFSSFQKFLVWTRNQKVVPSFFQYTQELWTAYITTPFVKRMVRGAYNRRITTSDDIKYLSYQLPPRIKLTGYERNLTHLFKASEAYRTRMPLKCKANVYLPYKQVLEQLGHPLVSTQ